MLSANRLGDAMRAAVHAVPVSSPNYQQEIFRAMAQTIISEIIAYGVVAVTSVSGVTSGPGVSGPGVGSIT
jgi:hypothetical protein